MTNKIITRIHEATPERYRCLVAGCPSVFEAVEVTPDRYVCMTGACPAVFELTPENYRCGVGPCPGVFVTQSSVKGVSGNEKYQTNENYLIVGEQITPEMLKSEGLEELAKKVGPGEVLIKVPKGMIDELPRKE